MNLGQPCQGQWRLDVFTGSGFVDRLAPIRDASSSPPECPTCAQRGHSTGRRRRNLESAPLHFRGGNSRCAPCSSSSSGARKKRRVCRPPRGGDEQGRGYPRPFLPASLRITTRARRPGTDRCHRRPATGCMSLKRRRRQLGTRKTCTAEAPRSKSSLGDHAQAAHRYPSSPCVCRPADFCATWDTVFLVGSSPSKSSGATCRRQQRSKLTRPQ